MEDGREIRCQAMRWYCEFVKLPVNDKYCVIIPIKKIKQPHHIAYAQYLIYLSVCRNKMPMKFILFTGFATHFKGATLKDCGWRLMDSDIRHRQWQPGSDSFQPNPCSQGPELMA